MSTADAFSPGFSPHGVKGGDPAEGLGGGLPASLPDECYLTRLANELFSQVPGGVPSGLNPGGLPPSGLQVGAPSWLAADAPALGAVGTMSNSNLRPSAHGASIPGMVAPRGAPSAVPLPGEAELRGLLASRSPSLGAAQPGPVADPVSAENLALSGADAPGVGAVGARSNSNLRPSAHGASIPGMAASRGAPSAIPLPGEAELRSLLTPRLASPVAAQPLPGADPAAAEALALSGADAPGAGAVGARSNSTLRPSAHGAPLPATPRPSEAPMTVPPSAGYTPAAPGSSFYFLDESRRPTQGAALTSPQPGYDVYAVRRDFPILNQRVNGHPLIWLDNAATTQKPQAVIDRLVHFYSHENSNVHRGAHELAARSTDAYEDARKKVSGFLGASSSDEIVFVRGATEAINLVAQSWGRQNIGKDDEIVITWLEHHANIVPWQQLCTETGAVLKVAPVDDRGQVRLDAYEKLLGPRTKLVSFTEVSNALGTVTPAKQMAEMAHRYGARVLIDGAQAVSHMPVNVQELGADWYVLSGHKVFAPTGIGVLYGKKELLDSMPPWQGGGNMIRDVTFEHTAYHDAPGRFEAGTGNIADAVGLGAAIDYLGKIGMEKIAAHEQALIAYATKLLPGVPGLRIVGTAAEKAGVVSFVLEGQKSEAVGGALNQYGIAVRSGHHCAQPILRRFGLEATVRPSFALYNTYADIDALVSALRKIQSGHNALLG
jgi:cysteine desulfurase/selenocysteine lyase